MNLAYSSKKYELLATQELSADVTLFTFKETLNFKPGQIIEVHMPGFGQAPFAPTSDPDNRRQWQLAVRKLGIVTQAIHKLKPTDKIEVIGPFGHGWSLENIPQRTIIAISGGLGIVPMRPAILQLAKNKKKELKIFHGSRDVSQILFKEDFEEWKKSIYCRLTLDTACPNWDGEIGFVTSCLEKATLDQKNSVAFVCGPPVMFKNTIAVLEKKGFSPEQIYISLERRMQCGIGKCQHCAIGPYYVCKDGPVFRYDKVEKFINF